MNTLNTHVPYLDLNPPKKHRKVIDLWNEFSIVVGDEREREREREREGVLSSTEVQST
jgi:phage gp37-like protein